MANNLFYICIIGVLTISVLAIPTNDQVTGLNGPDGEQCSFPLNQPWYSGYLKVNANQQFHYVFFPSQGVPGSDPVLLWLNGGPGCSSLLGATQENGPFYFLPNSTNMVNNPYSWNMHASVLYLESPPGVGFSVSSTVTFDDNSTATLNLAALVQFFQEYPEFSARDFYIAGESYGGVYVPMLAYWILQNNIQNPSETINIQGIIVGNGCTHPTECEILYNISYYQYDYQGRMGFYGYSTWQQYKQYCYPEGNYNNVQCNDTINTIDDLFNNINMYDVFGTCYFYNTTSEVGGPQGQSHPAQWLNKNRKGKSRSKLSQTPDFSQDPPCVDAWGPDNCFNNITVQKALHVAPQITSWNMCSNTIGNAYTKLNGSYYLYPSLYNAGLRIWIYSGDTDSAVPIEGTLTWIQQLKLQLNASDVEFWRPWYSPGNSQYPSQRQNAGSVWKMDDLTFVRFKGVGHMVPQYNRVGAYEMINAFLNNQDLPYS